jgi:hypothetical protein
LPRNCQRTFGYGWSRLSREAHLKMLREFARGGERLEQLVALRDDSTRLKLKTLGALIGGAFSAGVGTTLAWPWISATFAPHGDFALLVISVGIGLAIALST